MITLPCYAPVGARGSRPNRTPSSTSATLCARRVFTAGRAAAAFKGGLDMDAADCAAGTPCDVPAGYVDYVRHEPGSLTANWWRGVGPTHTLFVVESILDKLAAAAKQAPVAFSRAASARLARQRRLPPWAMRSARPLDAGCRSAMASERMHDIMLPAQHRLLGCAYAMHLDDTLGRVRADPATLLHGRPSLMMSRQLHHGAQMPRGGRPHRQGVTGCSPGLAPAGSPRR